MEGLPAVVCVKAAWVGDDGTDFTAETQRHGEEKAVKSGWQKSIWSAEKGFCQDQSRRPRAGCEIAVPITVRIPTYLASFADGRNLLIDRAAHLPTVSEALTALWKLYPGLRDRIVDEQGAVRQHINIFVGDEAIRFADGFSTTIPTGAEVLIVPAVSGG